MIMSGTTPRALSWRGLAAVLGMSALMLPAWARAQEAPAKAEPDQKPDFAVVRFGDGLRILKVADAAPQDAEKETEELKALEAQLAQKQAEVADLAAKVELLRARVSQGAATGRRILVKFAGSDGDPAAFKDLIQRIQAAMQSGAPRPEVIVLDEATGKILLKMAGANPTPQAAWTVKVLTSPPAGAQPPTTDADRRIDELEQKLKSILDEVENLRRERKPIDPATGKEPETRGDGPTPLDKIPYINRLFRIKQAQEQEEVARALAEKGLVAQEERLADLARSLRDLQVKAEGEKAHCADLEAVRERVLVKVKEWADRRDKEVGPTKADVAEAEASLQQAQALKELAQAQVKSGGGEISEGLLKQAAALAEARRAELERARADLARILAEDQSVQQERDKALAACEDQKKAAEENLKKVEEEIRKVKNARGAGDGPSKP